MCPQGQQHSFSTLSAVIDTKSVVEIDLHRSFVFLYSTLRNIISFGNGLIDTLKMLVKFPSSLYQNQGTRFYCLLLSVYIDLLCFEISLLTYLNKSKKPHHFTVQSMALDLFPSDSV